MAKNLEATLILIKKLITFHVYHGVDVIDMSQNTKKYDA